MKASTIRCLITAGPTREFFDPVRFLSNPSTGKMGFALAEAARDAGWSVILVSGPVALPPPPGLELLNVVTGEEMYEATARHFPTCDILIMTAAVMDYRPREKSPQKVKKDRLTLTIEMEPTRDILKTLGWQKTHQVVVGFAAETENVESYAWEKLRAKNCDFLVANQVGGPSGGFAADDNTIHLLGRDGSRETLGPDSKTNLARIIIARCGLEMAKHR